MLRSTSCLFLLIALVVFIGPFNTSGSDIRGGDPVPLCDVKHDEDIVDPCMKSANAAEHWRVICESLEFVKWESVEVWEMSWNDHLITGSYTCESAPLMFGNCETIVAGARHDSVVQSPECFESIPGN